MPKEFVSGIPCNESTYNKLLFDYEKAKKAGHKEFRFLNHDWLIDYIKYVLELMRIELRIKEPTNERS